MFNSLIAKVGRYKLTATAAVGWVLLFSLVAFTFARLCYTSMDKSRIIRSELFDRDLRDLVGQFDADERYVLDKNLNAFLSEKRALTPLLLPRQYYVALPDSQSKFTPRPPPRNCFIDMESKQSRSDSTSKFPERFCSYFADNRNLGTYLFMSMAFNDSEIKLLRSGDVSFSADSINVIVESLSKSTAWLVYMQLPKSMQDKGRYQLTAFRLHPDGRKEIDKRFEGWAYVQHQANSSSVVNLIARLDFKEFVEEQDEKWPPNGWQNTRVKLSRINVAKTGKVGIEYKDSGLSNLSLPSLSPSIFNAYGMLSVTKDGKTRSVNPPSSMITKASESGRFIRVVDGDLLVSQNPIVRSQLLQDTNIEFSVKHPGTVLDRSIWETGLLLAITLIGFLYLFRVTFYDLLQPVWILSQYSRRLMTQDLRPNLPFSDKGDEIGALAKGFNELLKETREQAARELIGREKRAEEVRIKQIESIKAREDNLQVIWHEILSPLQALISIHKNQNSKSWRYIDRITKAVTQLFGASGPEAAYAAREIVFEELDISLFLKEVADNSPLAEIPNVIFNSTHSSLIISADQTVLEDAITNILSNANRHRNPGSPITITLSKNSDHVLIEIFNNGPHIPEENLSKIFDLYFTTESTETQIHGLGLFAARNYISRMQGSISACNELLGVNFIIKLPIHSN